MNQEQIRILIDALAASELAELEYSQDGCTLRLMKHGVQTSAAGDAHVAAPAEPAAGAASGHCLAPLYGVVHLQPAPGEPMFVTAGQPVAAGQTLCVIEAMKVFNEVRAESDLSVVEVLVESGTEVEAGQPLFRLA